MVTRVDQRDVIVRAEDAVMAADYELRTGIVLRRCECGATLITVDGLGRRCAGCGVDLHHGPAAHSPSGGHGDRGRDGRSMSGVPSHMAAGRVARFARSFLIGWRS